MEKASVWDENHIIDRIIGDDKCKETIELFEKGAFFSKKAYLFMF
ncbi:hypothetical protein [Bacillus niameyensis]|nr:hypothetical protein [Bacillus niameyensis]